MLTPQTDTFTITSSLPLSRSSPTTAPTPSPVGDPDLVAAAGAGDDRALGALYDRFAAMVYAVALRLTRDATDAEEVVLETFAQAWREAPRFDRGRGSVAAWLTMMARSRALDAVRARGRRDRLAQSAQQADPGGAPVMGRRDESGAGDPMSAVDLQERAQQVRAALGTLSEPQRQAIELAYYEGLSHSEIAERLQEPLGTVKTRLRLAMQKLRDALRPYYFEGSR